MTLEIIEGPEAGRRLPIEDRIVLGRTDAADVVIGDPQISRRHVLLAPDPAGVLVEDLGSRNGTFLNGQPVHGPATLRPGDHLIVGVSVLELRGGDEITEVSSAVRPIPPALAADARPPDYVPAEAVRPVGIPALEPLLDSRVKAKARLAPLAVFSVAVLTVLIFLAGRGGL